MGQGGENKQELALGSLVEDKWKLRSPSLCLSLAVTTLSSAVGTLHPSRTAGGGGGGGGALPPLNSIPSVTPPPPATTNSTNPSPQGSHSAIGLSGLNPSTG